MKKKSTPVVLETVKDHIKKECAKSRKFKEAYEDFADELNDKGTLKIVAEARKSIKNKAQGISASKVLKKK